MASVEERLAYLEGKVDEQARGTGELRDAVRHLDHRLEQFRTELSARIDALDQKVDRFRDELSARIDRLEHRTSTHFMWLVGLQITVLVAVAGALLAR
jgi:uncharacterized coiled-coil protein SlyX